MKCIPSCHQPKTTRDKNFSDLIEIFKVLWRTDATLLLYNQYLNSLRLQNCQFTVQLTSPPHTTRNPLIYLFRPHGLDSGWQISTGFVLDLQIFNFLQIANSQYWGYNIRVVTRRGEVWGTPVHLYVFGFTDCNHLYIYIYYKLL